MYYEVHEIEWAFLNVNLGGTTGVFELLSLCFCRDKSFFYVEKGVGQMPDGWWQSFLPKENLRTRADICLYQ
jgi:hypothetical protein